MSVAPRTQHFSINAQIDALGRAIRVVAGSSPKPQGSKAEFELSILRDAEETLVWLKTNEAEIREWLRMQSAGRGSRP